MTVQPKGLSPRKRSDESQACGGSVSTTSIGTYMATLEVRCVRAWWAAHVTGATPRLILRVRLCATRVQSLGRGSRAGQGRRGELLLRAGRTLPPPASPLLLCVRVPLPVPSFTRTARACAALTAGVQILRQLHVHQVSVAVLLRAMQGHPRGTPLPEVQSLSSN